jgi:hypothetical protein
MILTDYTDANNHYWLINLAVLEDHVQEATVTINMIKQYIILLATYTVL